MYYRIGQLFVYSGQRFCCCAAAAVLLLLLPFLLLLLFLLLRLQFPQRYLPERSMPK